MAEKPKYSFRLNGIDYTNITGRKGYSAGLYIGVTGTAQMVRQYLAKKYPRYAPKYVWVKSESFANGDSINVSLNRIPEEDFLKIKSELNFFEYGTFNGMEDMYVNKEETYKDEITGERIDFGTKYLQTYNQPPYDSAEKDEPAPDWSNIPDPTRTSTPARQASSSTGGASRSKWSYGNVVKVCGGWKIYKNDWNGKVVFNAVKDKETKSDKENWATIRGEIQIETNFRWNPKFQAFARWGDVPEMVLDKLCSILEKWYGSVAPAAPQPAQPASGSYTQQELLQAIQALDKLEAKGNAIAGKQANVLRYLLK